MDEILKEARAEQVSRAFARSVRNNTLAEFGAQGIRMSGLVVLARALTPSDFGSLKALVAITAIVRMSLESGIPDALIQRKHITHEHECTAWWLSCGVALVGIGAMFAAADLLARWMHMPELKDGLRLLCLPLLINSASTVSGAQLQRQFRFDALAWADVLAEAAFLSVALALVLYNQPRWSLVGGLAARFAAQGLTIWIFAGIPLGMPRMRAARDLAGFAFSVWGGRVIQAASETSDYLLIGRILGGGPLGLYGMARDLLRFIPDRLHRVAGRVTYAAFCQLQDDDEELARSYTNFFGSIARIIWPIMVCMAVTAPDLVSTAYGHQWIAAALPLRLLTAGMIAAGLTVAISSIYFAKGYPSLDIHLNGLRLILMVVAVVASRRTGLLGVVAAVSGVELVSALAAQYVCCRFTGLVARDLIAATMPGVRLAIACGLVAAAGEIAAHCWGIAGPLSLLIAGTPAAIVYLHYEGSSLIAMAGQAFGTRATAEPVRPVAGES